ncbi:hypothetical protein, partial [Salmonella enterica]|uniref:hypothetical protein n=1 Tax=Salmonella enterica TaxID=28901 RepID=UPI003F1A55C1
INNSAPSLPNQKRLTLIAHTANRTNSDGTESQDEFSAITHPSADRCHYRKPRGEASKSNSEKGPAFYTLRPNSLSPATLRRLRLQN